MMKNKKYVWQQWLKNHGCPAGQQRFLAEPLYVTKTFEVITGR
jgi:hypothetical protein